MGNQKSRTPKPEMPLENEKSRTLNVEVIYPSVSLTFIFYGEGKADREMKFHFSPDILCERGEKYFFPTLRLTLI